MRQAPRVQRWIEQNYFTAWTLSDEFIRDWVGVGKSEDVREHVAYQELRRAFNSYLDDPLGDRGDVNEETLAALTRTALPSANASTLRRHLRRWLDDQELVTLPDDRRDEAVLKLEFVLLLAVLAERLNVLIRRWKQVEVPLDLEEMCAHLQAVRQRGKMYSIVVASEGTDIPHADGAPSALDAFGHVILSERGVGEFGVSVAFGREADFRVTAILGLTGARQEPLALKPVQDRVERGSTKSRSGPEHKHALFWVGQRRIQDNSVRG